MRILTFMVAFCALATSASLLAGELDNETQVTNVSNRALPDALPNTLVVRVAKDTNQVSVFQTAAKLPSDASSVSAIAGAHFTDVLATDKVQGSELDRDSSTDSWFYFYNYNYYNPCFYYGGYNYYYNNYYNYSYGPYTYYYYNYWNRW